MRSAYGLLLPNSSRALSDRLAPLTEDRGPEHVVRGLSLGRLIVLIREVLSSFLLIKLSDPSLDAFALLGQEGEFALARFLGLRLLRDSDSEELVEYD